MKPRQASADPPTGRAVRPPGRSLAWKVALQVAIVLGAGILAVRAFDLEASPIADAFRRIDAGTVLGFCLLMAVAAPANALRWVPVSRAAGVPRSFWFLLRVVLVAELANLLIPSVVGGEALKVWKLSRGEQSSRQALVSVALDRVAGIGILVLACIPWLPSLLATARRSARGLPAWLLTGALVAGAGLALLVIIRRLPSRAQEIALLRGIRLRVLAWGLLPLFCLALAYAIALDELGGIGWWSAAAVAMLSRLGRAVPLSVLGVSAVEGATIGIGVLYGIPAELLVVVAALNLLVRYVVAAAGLVWELSASGTEVLRSLGRLRDGPATPEPGSR